MAWLRASADVIQIDPAATIDVTGRAPEGLEQNGVDTKVGGKSVLLISMKGKCRKDKGHDLWYRPGPLAEFRGIPMRCLSCRSRQQQHLLQWLQTLSA